MTDNDVAIVTEATTIAELAARALDPVHVPAGVPSFVVVPAGSNVVGLEAFGAAPWRTRGAVAVADVDSLIAYLRRHATELSAVFASDAEIVAVLNFRGAAALELEGDALPARAGAAGHGDDRVTLKHVESPEWIAWAGVDGKRLTHAVFAEWLEDHVPEIVEPSGAALLELAGQLSLRRDVEFRSAVRLQSGAQSFAYAENDAGVGALELPASIALGIPPFEGSPGYRLEVRIRYRLEAGKLALWFARVRPDLVLRAERLARLEAVRAALPAVPVYRGTVIAAGLWARA